MDHVEARLRELVEAANDNTPPPAEARDADQT